MSKPFHWSEVTAVFGGTFDPPHLGHKQAVQGLFKLPGIRRVLAIPSFIPPQKPNAAASHHRVAMTKLCFAGLPDVVVDTREIDRGNRSHAPSFTFDTLLELKKDYSKLAFTLGSDQLANLHSWHRFPEVLELCHWIVLARKPHGEKQALEALHQWQAAGLIQSERSLWKTRSGTFLKTCDTPATEISSRNIREKIALAHSDKELTESLHPVLPPEILSYLMEQRIYGMPSRRK